MQGKNKQQIGKAAATVTAVYAAWRNRRRFHSAHSFQWLHAGRIYVTSILEGLKLAYEPNFRYFENIIRKIATRDNGVRHCCATLDVCTHLSGGNISWKRWNPFFGCVYNFCIASYRHPSIHCGTISCCVWMEWTVPVEVSAICRQSVVKCVSMKTFAATTVLRLFENRFDIPKNKAISKKEARSIWEKKTRKHFKNFFGIAFHKLFFGWTKESAFHLCVWHKHFIVIWNFEHESNNLKRQKNKDNDDEKLKSERKHQNEK